MGVFGAARLRRNGHRPWKLAVGEWLWEGIKTMTTVTIPEAQANLPELVENLQPGEEVIITSNQQPVAKLIPFSSPGPRPVFGSCHGKLVILAEDEEHLDDFKDHMP
jgi:prevent-host-death family protein